MRERQRPWHTSSRNKHFDVPVRRDFVAKTASPAYVASHAWLPHIAYTKWIKRYKRKDGKTVYKDRPIMSACHRDTCILKRYALELTARLEALYTGTALDECVIAYRKLGKGNYDFAAEAREFAQKHSPCVVLCFDISGFFDNLDYAVLKQRLKGVLDVTELSRTGTRSSVP